VNQTLKAYWDDKNHISAEVSLDNYKTEENIVYRLKEKK
jgi:hypothetical protein